MFAGFSRVSSCFPAAGEPLLSLLLLDMAVKLAGELNHRLHWGDISNQRLLLSLPHCYLSCHMFAFSYDLHSLAIVLEDWRLSEGSDSTRLSLQFLLPR